jgi:GNAT superfamily N-acetyltransferase
MKLIVDSNSYSENVLLINSFKELYINAFPDINEREDFEVILQRVLWNKQPNEPHSILILTTTNGKNIEVTGGLIADWYENSKAIHLIYLVTAEKYRGKGIAKKLINEGVPAIKHWIENEKKIEIRNVFFESNNPEKTKNDNFDTIARLEIFSRFGAKWINIPYVQPALDKIKKEVDNLYLLSFTQFNAKGDKITENEIIAFLKDLYLSLGQTDKNKSFIKMQKVLENQMNANGDIELQHIPETTFYKFYNSSVTWHFVQKNKQHIETSINNPFSSFEKDLLNFHNQKLKEAPFNSVFKELYQNAKIIFPAEYSYTSEGRKHTKTTKSDRIELEINLSVSCTNIENSDNTIWHVTFAPKKGHYFTESDLIKLSSVFGSSQEQSTVKDNLKITLENEKLIEIKPDELICRLGFAEKNTRLENLQTGIIQIETFKLDAIQKINFNDFFKLFQNKNKTEIENDSLKQFSKTICGIILGIFDFNRMDDDEIFDTIQPIVQAESSFIVLCRGALFKISEIDELMESVVNHVVVSPYLLVPNMVLAYNEFILMQAKNEIDSSLNPDQNKSFKTLETSQRKVRNILNMQYLRDIFQYPSEKEIVEFGNSQRGIINLQDILLKRIEELSELIETKKAKKSNLSDAILNALLGFIAALQLKGLFEESLKEKYSDSLIYISTVLFAFAVAGAIFWLIRMKKN